MTQDVDYGDLSVIEGFPPGIVLIRLGNCSTSEIEVPLRESRENIEALTGDSGLGLLLLL